MKSSKNPKDVLVSTIIPSYNMHHFLKEALFSVLQQTHENMEIIIINDYPTEQSKDTLNDFKNVDPRIKVLHNSKNIGIANSRNKAISYA
jgi:glycosyltransferase involved in cell wall biosynthesis